MEVSLIVQTFRTIVFSLCSVLLLATTAWAAQTGSSRVSQIQDHFRRATEFLKASNSQAAAKEFNALLALQPKDAEAQAAIQVGMELAGLYYGQGDLENAAAVVHSLMDLNPDNADILYLAQLVYTELADDTLNKLTIIAPGSARMQQVIAEHLVNAGDLKNAIAHYKKCLEMNPGMPGVRYELAEAIFESSPTDPATQAEAQRELESAVKTEGDSSKVECELARIAIRRSDTQSAYAHYSRAFALNPREVDAQVGLGHMLMSTGKPREALKYLRMAVDSDPLNSEAHYRLASVYRSLQMTAEAEKEITLFQEIKLTKNQVKELYRQMNKRPQTSDGQVPDDVPQ